jgi:hypothetical protein
LIQISKITTDRGLGEGQVNKIQIEWKVKLGNAERLTAIHRRVENTINPNQMIKNSYKMLR